MGGNRLLFIDESSLSCSENEPEMPIICKIRQNLTNDHAINDISSAILSNRARLFVSGIDDPHSNVGCVSEGAMCNESRALDVVSSFLAAYNLAI